VAFIDNDVIPERGWLEALRRCMDETGAWIVGPLYCEGEPDAAVAHMAGGEAHFEESADRKHRWSDAWTVATVNRFAAKWNVDPSDPSVTVFLQFARNHRHMLLDPLRRPLLRVLGTRRSRWLRRTVLPSIETRLNRWLVPLDGIPSTR
jgi:hypothetical protein